MTRVSFSRRSFVSGVLTGAVAGAGIAAALLRKNTAPKDPSSAVFQTDRAARITTTSFIAADQARCSGCKICEAECALVRERSMDFGRSRITARRFEPSVDVVSLCTGCSDAPCVAVCPKEAGALTRDRLTGAVLLNETKCIGCQACLDACAKDRSAVIRMSRDGKKARGICDLCGGDPACVKVCPEQCLSIVPANMDGKELAVKPAAIALSLARNLYRSGRAN